MKDDEEYMSLAGQKFFNEKDLAFGSYGYDVDKYLGRSPIDGPPGYIFRKISYTATALGTKTNVAGWYRNDALHQGYIYHDGETGTEAIINHDGIDATTDQKSTLGEASLRSGDYILGTILQLVDGRGPDNRTGVVTAGYVTTDKAAKDDIGVDLTDSPGTFIQGSAIGGARAFAAGETHTCSVASPNLNIYHAVRVKSNVGYDTNLLTSDDDGTIDSDLRVHLDKSAPIHAINISGLAEGQSSSVRFVLNVYALVGPRVRSVSAYAGADPSFKLTDLTRKVARHPVAIV
jgi:hypothetical protein